MDLRSGIVIGRIRGIAIRVHWSWLFVFVLVAWRLQGDVAGLVPELSSALRWLAGFAAAAIFFLSVLLHELSHAFVALHHGMTVPSITLFIFGGASNVEGEMKTPGQEFQIAFAGPATSIVIGAILVGASYVVPPVVGSVLFYLGVTNSVLGVFNLLPGFPLDGGRVLRALLWKASGNMEKSTRVAAGAGTTLAWGLIAVGVYYSFATRSLAGVWFVLIGLFLRSSSESAYGQMMVERALEGVRVRAVMREAPEPVAPTMSLQRIVDERVLGRGERALFVGGEGQVLGLFTVVDLARISTEQLATTLARDIMVPVDQIITVGPDTPLLEATQSMTEHDFHQIPVVEDGRMVGVLTRGDVLQQLEVRQRFGR